MRSSSKIYSTLMSDIFKIKWAHALEVYSDKEFPQKSERIAHVFTTYFLMTGHEASEYIKLYPQTSAMIDNNQQIFRRSLKSLVILDNDTIFERAEQCSIHSPISAFVCGLHMPGNFGNNQHFVNLVVNEYLNYRFFIDYYVNQTQRLVQGLPTEAEKTPYLLEINALQKQRDTLEQALYTSLYDFQDFVMTYPLHIGFVLYQEELLRFRDKYASKMVTPFYTLYEKLRNVQPV